MTIDQILINIVLPIASTLVGGGITLFATAWTMRKESKVRKEEQEEDARPFFGVIDGIDARIISSNNHIFSFTAQESFSDSQPHLNANIINSDKTEFMLEKISINEKNYYPTNHELIAKQMPFMIKLYYDGKIDNCDVLLHVIDINHKKHIYKMIYSGSVVINIEEINHV